ncbi:hypothetical protein VZC37_17220 [Gordonia sp. LSe1-13]|uniref:DUF1349 domain-containing protein n=1 Tax=Gordonia sesuvii TaxID=3116777 RepID=A0ABU7MG53_9ACTN|nr:hypothetical protein [Gordonia sp. LSe1-13]
MGRVRRHRIAAATAAVVAALAIGGCAGSAQTPTPEPASPPPENIPASFDVTFRWLTGGVFDVFGQEGTFVRAFVESFELANAGRSAEWGYRGFEDAAPSNIGQMVEFYPSETTETNPGVGTAFFTGLRRVDEADWTRIVLCRYGYRSIKVSDGEWSIRLDAPRPVEIDFRRSGVLPPSNTRGTARTPDGDVFGDWHVTRYDFAAVYPRTTADEHACAAAAPAEVPSRLPGQTDSPWPPMAPNPGWWTSSPL